MFVDHAGWRFVDPKTNIWTIVPHSPINDVICYKGNFYAVAAYNNLYEVDLGPDPEMRLIDPWVQECITGESRYLVDYFGKHLLLVCRNKVKCCARDDELMIQPKNRMRMVTVTVSSSGIAVGLGLPSLLFLSLIWKRKNGIGGMIWVAMHYLWVLIELLLYAPLNFQVARLIASISLLIPLIFWPVINTGTMMLACTILSKIAWRHFIKTISQTHPCLLGCFPTLNY